MTWGHFPFISVVVCGLWCIGGQFWKPARRYILSVLMAVYAYYANREPEKRRACVVLLAMIGLLSAGYGEDSWLKKACGGSETITRLVMACLIASVFASYSIMSHHITWRIFLTFGVNVLAWQVRAGSLCRIGRFDLLIEDLCRSLAFSVSLMIA